MIATRRFQTFPAGFTLIEVMIVAAIVAILAAIAIPSYQESVRKSARADARGTILTMMQQQERYFSQNNTYVLVGSGASSTFKNWTGDSGYASAKWVLSSAVCAGDTIDNCVAVSASPQSGVWTDDVTQITYTSRGQSSCQPSGLPTNKCWPR